MTFILTVGLLSVSHAQQSTTALTGEWVGNIDSSGKSELARLSLTENAGEMRRPLKAKLTLVQLEGSRVRDYTVKVYPNGSHNLMEVPPDNLNESVRLKTLPTGFFEMMVDWTTTRLRQRAPARR